jgi:hypothetical protein
MFPLFLLVHHREQRKFSFCEAKIFLNSETFCFANVIIVSKTLHS